MKSYTLRPDTFTLNFNLLFQVPYHEALSALLSPASGSRLTLTLGGDKLVHIGRDRSDLDMAYGKDWEVMDVCVDSNVTRDVVALSLRRLCHKAVAATGLWAGDGDGGEEYVEESL